ncbi:MAG: L-threonylcarbamoyladenylate synthase [Methylotenera sp.]|nr:L-threonylcarbamoyladenylate synthase [Methylotenera sp.]
MRSNLHRWLNQGGLIAYATESCFGLGCDPRNAKAIQKLLQLKQRDAAKGLILIGHNAKQLAPFIAPLTPQLSHKMRQAWPAAHTWLVPASPRCPPALTGGRNTIAVRVPALQSTRNLCQLAGMALISTSANISGQKSIKTYIACVRQFSGKVRVIHGKIGHWRRPSRIQDLLTNQIIRK